MCVLSCRGVEVGSIDRHGVNLLTVQGSVFQQAREQMRKISIWIAGGGFKKGYVHGGTDDFGYAAVEKVMTVNDLHATLLHTLGLNHKKLTYPHEGRPGSLTDIAITKAEIVPELLA